MSEANDEECALCMGSGIVRYVGYELCGNCKGSGRAGPRCETCKGRGVVVGDRLVQPWFGRSRVEKAVVACRACGGRGRSQP